MNPNLKFKKKHLGGGGWGGRGARASDFFYKESKSTRILRGAMVEWLEQLGYSAESRRIA